jgi:hypothetical protein
MGDRGGQLAQGGRAGDPAELGLGLVQGVLGPPALGDVVVRLEDRGGPAGGGAPQRPAARHHHRGRVTPGVDELAFPAPGAGQLGHDVGERGGEDGLQAAMGHRAHRLRLGPSVHLLRPAIPVDDDVLLVADEDRVVGQVEELGLLPQRLLDAGPRRDLGREPLVAPREVRRPRLHPQLQLVAREAQRLLRAAAPLAQPADEERGEGEDRDAQREVEVEADRVERGVMNRSTTTVERRAASTPGPRPPSHALRIAAA